MTDQPERLGCNWCAGSDDPTCVYCDGTELRDLMRSPSARGAAAQEAYDSSKLSSSEAYEIADTSPEVRSPENICGATERFGALCMLDKGHEGNHRDPGDADPQLGSHEWPQVTEG